MFGPAFGPVIGGIVVTYKSWRIIFWMQTSMSGVAVLLTYFLLQETSHNIRASNLKGQGFTNGVKRIWRWANPVTVFKLYACRNLLFVVSVTSEYCGYYVDTIRHLLPLRLYGICILS